MEAEQYKIIPFAPKYAVSNLGNVMNLKKNKILKKTIEYNGYNKIKLSINNVKYNYYVHRLIAICFLDNPLNYKQVNHINGIKTDNNLINLEWCSAAQNMKHAINTGLINNFGENNFNSKLTKQKVIEIKKLLSKKVTNKKISKFYEVHETLISQIKNGKIWKHITI